MKLSESQRYKLAAGQLDRMFFLSVIIKQEKTQNHTQQFSTFSALHNIPTKLFNYIARKLLILIAFYVMLTN